MKRSLYLVLLLIISIAMVNAQDTIQTNRGRVIEGEVVDMKKPQKFYDPKVASRRSAILPGLGQIYNDSWWKVPILYAGFATSGYFIAFNNEQHLDAVKLVNEELAKPDPDPNLLRRYQAQADIWRKNRDLVILVTLGIYGLQIIEASIDAHLKGFNVDEDLAYIKPKIGVINNGTPYVGFGVTLPIGK